MVKETLEYYIDLIHVITFDGYFIILLVYFGVKAKDTIFINFLCKLYNLIVINAF